MNNSSLKTQIERIMTQVENLTSETTHPLLHNDYIIEDQGCPHIIPKKLNNGESAVYVFAFGETVLKIGKVGAKSSPRFAYQHYSVPSKGSTLARSLCADKDFQKLGVSPETVKSWMLNNTRRINIRIKPKHEKGITSLVELVLQYVLWPKYEDNIHNR